MAYMNVPGGGLPLPTQLYPSTPSGAGQIWGNGQINLAAGSDFVIPRGMWFVQTGSYSALQFRDPVNNVWRAVRPGRATVQISSDGFNCRVQNICGIPFGGVITNGGTGYVQATTTIAASTGGSVWMPVVGGALGATTIANPGSGYGIAPFVAIPGPPSRAGNGIGGIQASAYAVLTNGTVSAVSLTNTGAGYNQATITALLLPATNDPNYIAGTVSVGSVTFTIAGSAGKLTGALATNYGGSVPLVMSLTVGGSGTGATIVPAIGQTVTAVSVVAGGGGYGTLPPLVTSSGGDTAAVDAIRNPAISHGTGLPVAFQGTGVLAAQAITSVNILDGGFFIAPPNPVIIPAGPAAPVAASVASVTFTMGSLFDTIFLQPAGGS
jgi:hypothetical protein